MAVKQLEIRSGSRFTSILDKSTIILVGHKIERVNIDSKPFYFILHLLYDVMVIPLRGAEFHNCE
jgi:hypothetical protein